MKNLTKVSTLALLALISINSYALTGTPETLSDILSVASSQKSDTKLKDSNSTTITNLSPNNGTFYGFFVAQLYTNSTCTTGTITNNAGGNRPEALYWPTPALSMNTNQSIPIGQNALYILVWNTLSPQKTANKPSNYLGMRLSVVDTNFTSTGNPNTKLYGTSNVNATYNSTTYIASPTSAQTCLPITCNNTTLTCDITPNNIAVNF